MSGDLLLEVENLRIETEGPEPRALLEGLSFVLRQGERLDNDALRRQLAIAGYSAVTQVVTPGEFCFRGGIVDLFPMGSAVPYRLDLDDDVIETIRTFDVDSQRTLYAVKDIRLLPARELIRELLEWFIGDVVDELGSRKEVEYAYKILEEGTSADRQLATYERTGDLKAVVDQLIQETEEGVL